jgi:hypothetical protein
LAAATSLAIVWWWVGRPLLDLVHGGVATGLRGLIAFFGGLLGGERPPANPSSGSPATVVTPPPTATVNPVTPPPEWFDLFLLVAVGALFAFAFVVFHRRVKAMEVSGSRVSSVLRAIWKALWAFAQGTRHAVEVVFPATNEPRLRRDRWRRSASAASPAWSPTDPMRRRIAGEYCAFLAATRERMGPISGAETPSELARRIEVDEASNPALGILTGIYEVARFSLPGPR